MPSIQWNAIWGNDYQWTDEGNEWKGQAAYCKQPYSLWKESLNEAFIKPYLDHNRDVLEIAPGYGRWTPYLLDASNKVHLVDLNESCIEHCKNKFQHISKLSYHVNDGKSLHSIADESIDFIWSYDSFVHIELEDIDSYFSEFQRVLKPEGRAVIHHADRLHNTLILWPFFQFLPHGRKLFKHISMPKNTMGGEDGMRSMVSAKQIEKLILKNGLYLIKQTDVWGNQNQFNCKRFGDQISIIQKNKSPATKSQG